MKLIQSALFRALISVIMGVLLVRYREETVTWVTIAIGVLFLVSGVISCSLSAVSYLSAKKATDRGEAMASRAPFPVVGAGSVVLGLILVLRPATFTKWLMYVMAAMLILGAVCQFVALASASRKVRIGAFYWVLPAVILLVGILAVVQPSFVASAPLLIIGWCMVVYGVSELINAVKLYRVKRYFEHLAAEAEVTALDVEAEAVEVSDGDEEAE